jgi:hypothetical protein
MARLLIAIAMTAALATPASAQLSPQQQRMKDCNAQATGMTGRCPQVLYEFLPKRRCC